MIGRVFRGLGIDSGNDVLLANIVSTIILDDANKIATLVGGLLLIVYTGLGIWEKFKKLTKKENAEDETLNDDE